MWTVTVLIVIIAAGWYQFSYKQKVFSVNLTELKSDLGKLANFIRGKSKTAMAKIDELQSKSKTNNQD